MTRRSILLFTALTAVALFACSKDNGGATTTAAKPALRELTVDQVAARLAASDGKTFIYDANLKESWVDGHVPGAKWVDDENITVADLPADKAATLIFYCHNET
jgi:hypothetical protein